ncbi:preprotein translocase [Bacillus thuringiensis]|uniref:preprotein translocase n=1 Tax=Bacillus thuringiensis TaxID=1428 RepID=UPI000A35FA4E|nr:preprotein translocase [Bacillus thuringiensis]MDY8164081.1 preprotein translocase [Bacillus thuringiensis]MED3069633.1 preprotein translocase [Bacillus thuringiensis]OUB33080.1 preprotein translocase [Bacillus thuringiensis serovar palmanyolensis]
MNNSDMMLRLLADLKIEHQELKEQLEKLKLKLTSLEEKKSNKKTIVSKQHRISGFPTSFHDWRKSIQKNKY